ncbi:unnamed protein product, partial [marine sediment metagenome]
MFGTTAAVHDGGIDIKTINSVLIDDEAITYKEISFNGVDYLNGCLRGIFDTTKVL